MVSSARHLDVTTGAERKRRGIGFDSYLTLINTLLLKGWCGSLGGGGFHTFTAGSRTSLSITLSTFYHFAKPFSKLFIALLSLLPVSFLFLLLQTALILSLRTVAGLEPLRGPRPATVPSPARSSNPRAPESRPISRLLIEICCLGGSVLCRLSEQADLLASIACAESLANGLFAKPQARITCSAIALPTVYVKVFMIATVAVQLYFQTETSQHLLILFMIPRG